MTAPSGSSASVRIISRARDRLERAVEELTGRLLREHPDLERVIWFGSWITGRPGPGSDVDLCLVLRESPLPFRERIPRFLPDGFPVGLDLFPYTIAELEQLRLDSPQWHRCLTGGRVITRA